MNHFIWHFLYNFLPFFSLASWYVLLSWPVPCHCSPKFPKRSFPASLSENTYDQDHLETASFPPWIIPCFLILKQGINGPSLTILSIPHLFETLNQFVTIDGLLEIISSTQPSRLFSNWDSLHPFSPLSSHMHFSLFYILVYFISVYSFLTSM